MISNEQRAEPNLPQPSDAHIRVSDRERDKITELLSAHAASGRLSTAELETRLERVHAARTRGELAELTEDLPAEEHGDRPRRRTRSRPMPSGDLAAFLAVNLMLVTIWALTGAGYFWPIWPMLGWGLGLLGAGHGACGRPHTRGAPGRMRPTGG